MPTTVALVRWNGGWTEVVHQTAVLTYGRSEGFLSLGAEQSENEAERLARAELEDKFGRIQEQVTVEHRPEDVSKVPFIGYRPGDKITAPDFYGDTKQYPVQSITVNEDQDGVLSFVPSIGDTIMDVDDIINSANPSHPDAQGQT